MNDSLSQAGPPSRLSFPSAERLAILVALVVTLYAAYVTVRPVLMVVLLAAAFASLLKPLYRRLVRKLRGRQRTAAALVLTGLYTLGLAPLGALGGVVVQRLVVEATLVAQEVRSDTPGAIHRIAERLGPAGPLLKRAAKQIEPKIREAAPELAERAAGALQVLGSAIMQIGIGLFLMAVAVYYFLLQGTEWRERVLRLLPLRPDDVTKFLERFHQVAVGVLVGSLGTALAQGAVATIGYWIFGAPVPLIWGVLTALAALVPAVGSVLVWGPVSLALGMQHGYWRGIGLALYGVAIVGTIDNVVRPILTKRGLRIHPLLIFMAIFGGVAAYGFSGLFLGPLVIALAITVVDLYERRLTPPKPAA